ncbi:MAG: hypothetical protein H6502_01370 [Candidatus Woesearchaeota archaeon]|nr:MAG: hypothetical protein H6502_01370 [Candidatus Woesearchaeota archaeon]
MVLMREWPKVVFTVLLAMIVLPCVTALSIVSPSSGEVMTNSQPLLDWSEVSNATSYTVLLSFDNALLLNQSTTSSYFQIQQELDPGLYTLEVRAIHTQELVVNMTPENGSNISIPTTMTQVTLLETATRTFTVVPVPSFSILVNLNNYAQNNQVIFNIDAPLHAQLEMDITGTNVHVPYHTSDLTQLTFATFLAPGTYSVEALLTYHDLTIPFAMTIALAGSATQNTSNRTNTTPVHELIVEVLADDTNDFLEGALVVVSNRTHSYSNHTNETGEAYFNLTEGPYNITASFEDYENETSAITLRQSRTKQLKLLPDTEIYANLTFITPGRNGKITELPFKIEINISSTDTLTCLLEATGEDWSKNWDFTVTPQKELYKFSVSTLEEGEYELELSCDERGHSFFEQQSFSYEIPYQPEDVGSDLKTKVNDVRVTLSSKEAPIASFLLFLQPAKRYDDMIAAINRLTETYNQKNREGVETEGELQELDRLQQQFAENFYTDAKLLKHTEELVYASKEAIDALARALLSTKGTLDTSYLVDRSEDYIIRKEVFVIKLEKELEDEIITLIQKTVLLDNTSENVEIYEVILDDALHGKQTYITSAQSQSQGVALFDATQFSYYFESELAADDLEHLETVVVFEPRSKEKIAITGNVIGFIKSAGASSFVMLLVIVALLPLLFYYQAKPQRMFNAAAQVALDHFENSDEDGFLIAVARTKQAFSILPSSKRERVVDLMRFLHEEEENLQKMRAERSSYQNNGTQ